MMPNSYLYIFIVLVYAFFVTFESFGLIARQGGFRVGFASIGLSLQNQILSLNRFVGFLIAPLLGFYSDTGGTKEDILTVGLIGNGIAAISLIIVFLSWNSISKFMCNISYSLVEYGYSFNALRRSLSKEVNISLSKAPTLKLKLNFFIAQLFTTGLAMPSVFVLNILALKYPPFSATLLQMGTAISGIGNLILNFYTVPLLSVNESRSDNYESDEIVNIYRSIFIGKVIGVSIFSPLILFIGYIS